MEVRASCERRPSSKVVDNDDDRWQSKVLHAPAAVLRSSHRLTPEAEGHVRVRLLSLGAQPAPLSTSIVGVLPQDDKKETCTTLILLCAVSFVPAHGSQWVLARMHGRE